jgi:hypothetical protein
MLFLIRNKKQNKKRAQYNPLSNWLKKELIRFCLIMFSVFFIVVNFSPSDSNNQISTMESEPQSCPVIFHRFVGGAYGLEIEREEMDPAYWLMVDSKQTVKQLKKNQIQLLNYEQFIKKLSPASVGVVSSTIYKAYGNIQDVHFFRGNSVDISRSENSTCLSNLTKKKAGLKKYI